MGRYNYKKKKMSVTSDKSDKGDKYIEKYENMYKQLEESINKLERLEDEIDTIYNKDSTKVHELNEEYEKKMNYYKECMRQTEERYKHAIEDNRDKRDKKVNKKKKEVEKSENYIKTVRSNIQSHILACKKHGIELDAMTF